MRSYYRLTLRTDADPLIGFPYNLVRIVGKAVSAKKGEKVIFEEKLKGNDTLYGINGVIDAQIFGHLLSPFESRAAVILVEVVRVTKGRRIRSGRASEA